jgi:hypothetical protein
MYIRKICSWLTFCHLALLQKITLDIDNKTAETDKGMSANGDQKSLISS